MPNIELHGFNKKTGETLSLKIHQAFLGKSYQKDYVISIFSTRVVDYEAMLQPFIRLVSTPHDHNKEILTELHKLGVDVEYLELSKFIPKS